MLSGGVKELFLKINGHLYTVPFILLTKDICCSFLTPELTPLKTGPLQILCPFERLAGAHLLLAPPGFNRCSL